MLFSSLFKSTSPTGATELLESWTGFNAFARGVLGMDRIVAFGRRGERFGAVLVSDSICMQLKMRASNQSDFILFCFVIQGI